MKKLRAPSQEEWGVLLAMLATIFGGWARLFPPDISGFPINDGGLFYLMLRAVQENGLRLPAYVQYNGLQVPFAYPPLAFYIGAILSDLFRLDAVEILHWLPAAVSIGTLPAFYSLAKSILHSQFKAGLATLLFAFTPRTMTWQIMGGGLTRSFGLLFLLLALANIHRLFSERGSKHLIPSILFSASVVLTHPEATLQTIGISLLFWIFQGRDKRGTLNAIFVGAGTLALTALWWIPLLLRLGPDPFLAAARTGSQSLLGILYPIFAILTDEPLMTLIAVLGLIGFAVCLANKDYFLPLFYFLPFLVEPRNSAAYAMIPLTMLASLALSDVILPAIAGLENKSQGSLLQSRAVQGSMAFMGFYLLGSVFYFGTQIAATTVSPANREALAWVRANTPAGSRFLVLTGDDQLLCDGVSEWFPALTDRISVTTVQGSEWLDGKFAAAMTVQAEMQSCISAGEPLSCVEERTKQAGIQYDYIYVARQLTIKNLCRVISTVSNGESLIAALTSKSEYVPIYQTGEVSIFSFHP